MKLIEIRDLDGPNIFLLKPAIKIEVAVDETDEQTTTHLAHRLNLTPGPDTTDDVSLAVGNVIQQAVDHLHDLSEVARPESVVQPLETPSHIAVAFGWDHRRFAIALAETIGEAVTGSDVDLVSAKQRLRSLRAERTSDDAPLMIRDSERTVRAIAVTGTNGKTTTTRLIAHLLRSTGLHVGWCSSSGVYIDGRQVIDGDYSGPSGARRVLEEPGLDAGVLETARGGILLRGTAYESNDISVFVNVSADHLDLQGIRTVEGLARVKSVVVRVTKADGVAILNADDPLVMASTTDIRAERWLVSQQPDNPVIASHVSAGGTALVTNESAIVVQQGQDQRELIAIDRVPIAYGGKARHMVENALCAAAAGLAFGLSDDNVRKGLAGFENSPEHNQGRLNVVKVGDVTVIVDYAHNESGLAHLLDFTRLHLKSGHRLITIIGTAGDRTDHSLREIGRVAATESDIVITKATQRYLRGRTIDNLLGLYNEGIALAGKSALATEPDELSALARAMSEARPGDAICIMAQEQVPEILAYLSSQSGS